MRLNKGIIGLMVATTVLLWSCSKTGTSVDPVVGPKGTAVDKLAKGINLSNWFNDYSDAGQYANRYNNTHYKQIKDAGFTYVRLPIGPSVISNPSKIEELQTNNLVHVENAVKGITAAGLSVV
ncbi:MAG: cellulase family glycosylhydrolase, partial [Sediminibacterium sp.]|uniref:cellulase family glycosylhydrolase n=1 Tax=Sediminibacterium sp. TaxID=1917865 RepID=UPI0027293C5E